MVPNTATSWWRPGQFGYVTRLDPGVLTGLRIVQVGWAYGDFREGSPVVKERLVRPEGFTVTSAAEQKHGISNARAEAEGVPLPDALREMVGDVTALVRNGARVCSHNTEFDAGIIAAELDRLGAAQGGGGLPAHSTLAGGGHHEGRGQWEDRSGGLHAG